MRLPLPGMEGAAAEIICHAADADARASAFGVPALSVSAATPRAPAAQEASQEQRWNILKQVGHKQQGGKPLVVAVFDTVKWIVWFRAQCKENGGAVAEGAICVRPLPGLFAAACEECWSYN
jgi:hypothetical protein